MIPSSTLPPELWSIIIDHLPRSDQLRISQVSHQLCEVARRIVYHNVELRSDNGAVRVILELLARDHSLARHIKKLHIHTTAEVKMGPAWFDADALAGMVHLHHLILTGMPFHTEDDQLKFNNTISKSLPALRKLEYHPPQLEHSNWPHTPDPETHVPVLQISGLYEFTWDDFNDSLHSSLLLTASHASCESLTHIRLNIFTSSPATPEPFIQFFSFQFPHLSTLQISGWNTVPAISIALTKFLIAHPLIEELCLSFSNPDGRGFHCYDSSDVALSPGTLPNLRHLTADATNFGIFVRSGLSSLQTLESLHTGLYYHTAGEEDVRFPQMYDALEVYGGLPRLVTLKLELEGIEDAQNNVHWVAGLGRLCPNVEHFWGYVNVEWADLPNQDTFASYSNLKSLVLPDMGLVADWRLDQNGIKEFVAHNPFMTDLKFYVPLPLEVCVINFHFRIERDAEGGITRIVEVLKNGSEIIWI